VVVYVVEGVPLPIQLNTLNQQQLQQNADEVNQQTGTESTDKVSEGNKDDLAADLHEFQEMISGKAEMFEEKSDDLSNQMQLLEGELMSRLAGLEDQLANKQEQEHSLRDQITNLQSANTGGHSDTSENINGENDDNILASLGENIVPSDAAHIAGGLAADEPSEDQYKNHWKNMHFWGPESYKKLADTTDNVPWVMTI